MFLQSNPPPPPPRSEQKKQSIITPPPFCRRLRPIRANHSTVGVVARRLLCVWFVAAWDEGARPAVSLPARPLPAPWLCLAVLAFKGKETHHWLHTTHQSLDLKKTNQLSFHKQNAHSSRVLSERPRLCLWLFLKRFKSSCHQAGTNSAQTTAPPSGSRPFQRLIVKILKVVFRS